MAIMPPPPPALLGLKRQTMILIGGKDIYPKNNMHLILPIRFWQFRHS